MPSKPAAMLLNSPATHTLVQSSGWGDPHDRVCGLPRKWAATARRRRGAYGRKGSPQPPSEVRGVFDPPRPRAWRKPFSRIAAVVRTSAGFSAPAVAQTTVPGAPIPASFTQAPAAHDGSSTFRLALEFSHESKRFSYRPVRDSLFDVEGGCIAKARRLERGRNLRWERRLFLMGLLSIGGDCRNGSHVGTISEQVRFGQPSQLTRAVRQMGAVLHSHQQYPLE